MNDQENIMLDSIAEELGYVAPDHEHNRRYSWYRVYRNEAGDTLTLRSIATAGREGQVKVSLCVRRDLAGYEPYWQDNRPKTSINVSLSKGKDAILKDIKRRLLPEFERFLEAHKRQKADFQARDTIERESIQSVADALGVVPRCDSQGKPVGAYFYCGNIRVDAMANCGTVELKIKTGAELAARICALIKGTPNTNH